MPSVIDGIVLSNCALNHSVACYRYAMLRFCQMLRICYLSAINNMLPILYQRAMVHTWHYHHPSPSLRNVLINYYRCYPCVNNRLCLKKPCRKISMHHSTYCHMLSMNYRTAVCALSIWFRHALAPSPYATNSLCPPLPRAISSLRIS